MREDTVAETATSATRRMRKMMKDLISELVKYAIDNGKRVTISVSQYDDGSSCVSVTFFEPEEESDE